MQLNFPEFDLHVPQPLACPAFSVNLSSHFVTVVYFSKSIIPLCARSQETAALSGEA